MARLLGMFFLLGGGIMLLAALWALIRRRRFERDALPCAAKVAGSVSRRVKKNAFSSQTVYDPVAAYTVDGVAYEAPVAVGAREPLWRQGDPLPILYLPDLPGKPASADGAAVRAGIAVSAVSAVIFLAAGVLLTVRT